MKDALEAGGYPELSDELPLPVAADRSGERSRMSLSNIDGSVGGCSSRRSFVRSPAFFSESETGECGRFWDGESVSIPGESVARPRFGEDGRAGATGEIDPGDGESIADASVGPETTFAEVRGLVGGVVDMVSTFGAVGGSTGFAAAGAAGADRVAFFRGHLLASWPETPHRKQQRI